MKYILLVLILCFSTTVNAQDNFKKSLKKCFRFSTFYGAVNGGNSISDVDVYSVSNGLQTSTIRTPYDYNVAVGVRKIARFGYENRAAFYDGNEKSWSDGANVGKVSGLEFLFELDYKRQQGQNYLNQHHFIRYVGNKYIFKGEYLEDGFANIKYFETSERYRHKIGNKLSFNVGAAQRLSEPYGYDPLDQWVLPNGDVHYTYLALQEGYTIDFENNEYKDPNGNVVATNPEIWTAVVVPEILKDYTEKERGNLNLLLQHSVVIGFDFYHYKKDFWLHAWGNVMPYHYNSGNEYSYHKYNNNKQWYDYAGGLIFGYKFNKNLGTFVEGKYNKYWNREWYNFKLGINYIIF
tara:strand:+ start:992 stop:2041 length:1050 start_codon:yes stop_codon:yes gene_type:complete